MGDFTYAGLAGLIEDAKKEAVIADMIHDGYAYFTDTEQFFKDGGGNTWNVLIDADGSTKSFSLLGFNADDIAEDHAEHYASVRSKWDKIDTLLSDWSNDRLPDPTGFDDYRGYCTEAITKLASGRGNAGSTVGNPALEELGTIRRELPSGNDQSGGQTLTQFLRKYGPDRIETVLDGHCEVAAVLLLALEGEKEVWTTARADIAALVGNAAEAFKQTRSGTGDLSAELTIVTATAGLVSKLPGGYGLIGKTVAAGGGFLETVSGALKGEDAAAPLEYSGSSPDEVYADLESAIKDLDEYIETQEKGIRDMLHQMADLVGSGDKRLNFHIHPGTGLAPSFAGTDTIVDLRYSSLNIIGYTSMPRIATAFFDGSDLMGQANVSSPWWRQGDVGYTDDGSSGPFPAFQDLVHAVQPLLDDTGAEVVRAGEALAEAGGYFRKTDEGVRRVLGDHYKELDGATLGWQDPFEPPLVGPRLPGAYPG